MKPTEITYTEENYPNVTELTENDFLDVDDT